MALFDRQLSVSTISAIATLARGSWGRADLEDTWQQTGWPELPGGGISALIFDRLEYRFDVAGSPVSINMTFDPDTVVGFAVEVAVFTELSDPAEEAVQELLAVGGDQATAQAARGEFDKAWADGCERLREELGSPVRTGIHREHWHHAIWNGRYAR